MKKCVLIFATLFVVACGGANNDSSSRAGNSANNAGPKADAHSDHKSMDHGSKGDVATTGHVMSSSPGAESAPFELQFLDSMIAHHQGAVEMAILAETRAARSEVKELAANIINDQEREIAKMSEWRDQWFGEKPEAVNMKFPGMDHGMRGMDMKKLESKTGADFDVEFIRQMIPHHEGAVEMANAVRTGDARAELKELAEDIVAAQDAEIKQMREWLSTWASR